MSEAPQSRQPPLIVGVMLVSGGAIGAGMFSLPVVSAGIWFQWSVVGLFAVWFVSYLSALLLLEANLLYPRGASFHTIVSGTLGAKWNIACGLGVAFLLYILIYAYLSAGGSIVNHTLESITGTEAWFPQNVSSMLFGFVVACFVWLGTAVVSTLCFVLLVAMILTFLMSNAGLLVHVELANLLNSGDESSSYYPYLWAALPYFVTAFGCQGLVPSLVKFYGTEPARVRNCLLYGTLIALVIYLLWMITTFGTLGRQALVPLINAGGNMGELVGALQGVGAGENMSLLLGIFSNFAITSSFLGAGLCLFDYVADGLGFSDDAPGRLKSALVTFLLPALVCFFFPDGFIVAIGYAGLVMLFSFFVVPVRLAWKNRSSKKVMSYQVPGGLFVVNGILVFSLVVGLCEVLAMFGLLPVYSH